MKKSSWKRNDATVMYRKQFFIFLNIIIYSVVWKYLIIFHQNQLFCCTKSQVFTKFIKQKLNKLSQFDDFKDIQVVKSCALFQLSRQAIFPTVLSLLIASNSWLLFPAMVFKSHIIGRLFEVYLLLDI